MFDENNKLKPKLIIDFLVWLNSPFKDGKTYKECKFIENQ